MIKAPFALLLISSLSLAAPLAEVWPYRASRSPAGVIEYSYDLSTVKAATATDARATHGDEQVKAYLSSLPREVKVRVKAATGYQVSAARGLEAAPLAVSFAAVSEDPMASDDPLERKGKGRMRALLHPDEVKLLPGAEMVLYRVRRIEDGALAAVELDTDKLRRDLLGRLLNKLAAKLKDAAGDAREGNVLLSARLAVAQSCLDPSKLTAKDPLVLAEATAQLQAMTKDPALVTPLGFYSWSASLQCSFRRSRVLAQPFDASRAGYAAPLVLLELFDADPALKGTWEKISARRQQFFGSLDPEPLLKYREQATSGASKALDDLAPFIDSLGIHPPPPPGVLALASSPFSRFLDSLTGAERLSAVDELWNAAQDGRITFPPGPMAPIQSMREMTMTALATSDAVKNVQLDAAWRDRLEAAFCALQSAHHEVRDRSWAPSPSEEERADLKVRLQVPPLLEVEPTPAAFRAEADSLERLLSLMNKENLASLGLVAPDSTGGAPIGPQLKKWEAIVRGLFKLSAPEAAASLDPSSVQAARQFLTGWRAEVAADVRQQLAGPVAFEDRRNHVVIAGVGRRELAVSFIDPPGLELSGGEPKSFELNPRAEQRYLVPVLVTAPATATATELPRSNAEVRKLVDGAGRLQSTVEGTLAHP